MQLEDFIGAWRLERQIDDRYSAQAGAFQGQARFTADAASGLIYDESGVLTLGAAAPMQAARRYLWRAHPQGAEVFFSDGRPFHVVNFAAPQATHHCDPDLYQVGYDFDAWPHWSATWHVTGPRKDYVMVSRYVPG